ncbi:hypothetical protein SLV14_003234 [Streptomyces sp. Je 1-4]|uniref:hypothetical protein n=1 Tax=Streptomyces TaxID=1883 RepID=UPI0021DA6540|nr:MULTISPECIES: hypothetical protein [unclassified Streptomyces]UYB40588.1 hypothetical protein SLV14_003234 [Streptomyces sp. Je 1-4]UZQ36722.1 hypothetical protein SLV14N_003234 [Streptomyces sp. Je 1-4] [Streptomyces sp. Je 1-4 4N24]UZQ44139.1 hypothetical protein SLV14NA_003234 [Streptomyces sp. Je 1-4] [Streptomyces sp. Je 1-4 4N24_ara]
MPWHEWRYIANPVRRWCALAPRAAVVHAFKVVLLAVALLNVGTLVNVAWHFWHNPPGAKGPRHLTGNQLIDAIVPPLSTDGTANGGEGSLDSLDALARGFGEGALDSLGAAVREIQEAAGRAAHKAGLGVSAITHPLADPAATATTAAALVLLIMFLLALRPALAKLAGPPIHVRGGQTAQWRPVVVLLAVCGSLGEAYKQWDTGGPLVAPRVSLAAAERALWRAWRTRHARIRLTRRRELKEHAALVVGALRAMEARQDTEADTGQVFEDTARMLLKIAQRYGEGRTLALLDPEDLRGVTPAVNREWVRLTMLGSAVVGTAVGANLLNVPDSAIGPLIGIVTLVTVGVLYGARLVATDLIDVMRGQSRK